MGKDIVNRLIVRWQENGAAIRKGMQEKHVNEFEKHNGVMLPSDFKHYFLMADGLSDDDLDGFLFWPLAYVKSVSVICKEEKVPLPAVDQLNQYFVFADYLQWSWAYAIYLSDRVVLQNPVIFVGTPEPTVIAQSFSEFIELYINSSPNLYVHTDAED